MYVTLPTRRKEILDKMREAPRAAMTDLRDYARERDGRFLVFGSVARGDIAVSSDFDLLVDFPASEERVARDFAAEACRRRGLRPDAHLLSEASETLVARASCDAMRSYGVFEAKKAGPAIAAASRLATTLSMDVARFKDVIDSVRS